MSQCTCTKDSQITCIVHPTEMALKARIAELEAVAEAAVDLQSLYDDSVPVVGGKWDVLEDALRAAGYLGGGEK